MRNHRVRPVRNRDVTQSWITQAEVLEERLLLSADFALTANVLRLYDFTQTADENLTIREATTDYEFVLSEGVWSGVDGGGATGAGSSVLTVDRMVAAGLKDGIRVIAKGIDADVALESADFSALAGGLRVIGAGDLSEGAGEILKVSTALLTARTISIGGTITGEGGDIDLIASRNIVFSDAILSTTSGAIRLQANIGAIATGGDFVGVLLQNDPNRVGSTTITTQSGTIGLKGRGGDGGTDDYGVHVQSAVITTATGTIRIDGEGGTGAYSNAGVALAGKISSTDANARAIVIRGIGGVQGGAGVVTRDVRLLSAEGDVVVEGRARNAPTSGFTPAAIVLNGAIESTGTGPNAATITVKGYAAAGGGTGVYLYRALLESVSGDIFLTGVGIGSLQSGVAFDSAGVKSTGTGLDAADIYVTGTISGSDNDTAYGISMLKRVFGSGRIDTVDGSVFYLGKVLDGRGSGVYAKQSFIVATGVGPDAGEISIRGIGSDHPDDYGLYLNAARITTVDTDIVFNGVTGLAIENGSNISSTGWGPDAGTLTFIGGHRPAGPDVDIMSPSGGVTYLHTSGGDIAFIGDEIARVPPIDYFTGTISVAPLTPGVPIDVGGFTADDGLLISNFFPDSATLRIGNKDSGDIRLRYRLVFDTRRSPELITGGSVLDRTTGETPVITSQELLIAAGGSLGDLKNPLEVATGLLAADAGSDIVLLNTGDLTLADLAAKFVRIGVIGDVAIAPDAVLDIQRLGSVADPLSPIAVIVDSQGDNPVSGSFLGLPEGASIRVTDNGIRRITYKGGDGNDIAFYTNSAPAVTDDRFRISEGESVQGDLLANDSDLDADKLKLIAINGDGNSVGSTILLRSGASLMVNSDGTFRYDANDAFSRLLPGETATDSFQYTVSDGFGGTATATVRIAITGTGQSDLVGFVGGGWYVAVSDGLKFTTTNWAGWGDVPWQSLLHGDVNGDGQTDVLGLYQGTWFIGISDGASFSTSVWTRWLNVEWQNGAVADLNGDGLDDILAEYQGQWWAALSTGSSFAEPRLWAAWSDLDWRQFCQKDLNADGKEDLLGYYKGEWWAGLSQGDHFQTPTLWDRWADVAWDAIGTFDTNDDQRQDVYGLIHGDWYVGGSEGTYFTTSLRARWSDLPWQDAVAGDFDGDGRDDLAAHYAGEWWLSLSGDSTVAKRWAVWADVEWRDTRVGDYNGDGLADIAGRATGEWWVATSNGDRFETSLWDTWQVVEWRAVVAVNASKAADLPSAALGERTQIADVRDDVAKMWSAIDDEELAAALLAI